MSRRERDREKERGERERGSHNKGGRGKRVSWKGGKKGVQESNIEQKGKSGRVNGTVERLVNTSA